MTRRHLYTNAYDAVSCLCQMGKRPGHEPPGEGRFLGFLYLCGGKGFVCRSCWKKVVSAHADLDDYLLEVEP